MLTTSKILRDLCWCIDSPSLLKTDSRESKHFEGISSRAFCALFEADELEERLQAHLSHNKSHFLGSYFEQLWLFYLTHLPDVEIICANQQIHHEGKTIGEFDVIFLDKKNARIVHQELAIKFYLGHPHTHNALWIGPQTIDRLDLKMDKLENHQLRLAQHEAAKAFLNSKAITHLESEIVMKGYLFQPRHLTTLSPPEYIAPNHLSGGWLTVSRLIERINKGEYKQSFWKRLNKLDWMVYDNSQQDESWLNSEQLAIDLGDFDRPWLLSHLRESEGIYVEHERLFVVADTWPNLTVPSPAL